MVYKIGKHSNLGLNYSLESAAIEMKKNIGRPSMDYVLSRKITSKNKLKKQGFLVVPRQQMATSGLRKTSLEADRLSKSTIMFTTCSMKTSFIFGGEI